MPTSKNRRKKPKATKKAAHTASARRPAGSEIPIEEPAAAAIEESVQPGPGTAPAVLEEAVALPEREVTGPAENAPGQSEGVPSFGHLKIVPPEEPATPTDESDPLPPVAGPVMDPFGKDPEFEARALKTLEVLYRRYFRVEARGIENVPAEGPAILVANHSGALPWDGAMLKCAIALDHPSHRSLRPLSENTIFHFPFLGVMFNRFGAVRACQENAEALLAAGEAVAVFPEGVKGLGKLFRKRYQLQRFGRGGFVKLAMRTRAPIIPVAIMGAEETHPLLARVVRPVEPIGLPYVPVTPTFPLLGPLGLLPLPTKWVIEFGEPLLFDDAQAGDELAIERLTEDVRGDIQARIDRLLSHRRTWFT